VQEKAGTATRVKGGRPGLSDRWKPATATAAPADDDSPSDALGAGSTAAEPADAGQSDPAAAGGTAQVGEADVGTAQEPDPVVTAKAAGNVLAITEEHLREFPDAAFTPHQVGKVLTRCAGAVANALDKLVSLGTVELATDKPRNYRLAPAPDAAGDPATSAEATSSAA